ncbi:MAG TPA: hypothetical protein PKK10_11230 [Woeseiaceae bacterium]|nr:hypothetical protein [Woeseiaceae bacterium]
MDSSTKNDAAASFERSVEDRFGILPNFFRLTPEAPAITRNLWGFAEFAYLDNPLPSLFKERLFVYLSQFCESRYCISRHIGFLTGLGHPAGDRDVAPESVEQIVRLLQRSLPAGKALDAHVNFCRHRSAPLSAMPEPGTAAEESVFACASHVFLQDADAPRSLQALKVALDSADLQYLLAFLTFVRTAHFWSKVHPDLRLEEDVVELLGVHEALNSCVLKNPVLASSDALQTLRNELDELHREEADLRSRAGESRFLA